MEDEKEFVTHEEAVAMLAVHDGKVHTFRDSPVALLGADWEVDKLVEWMEERQIEKTGPGAQGMKHGLAGHDTHGPLFIATKEATV